MELSVYIKLVGEKFNANEFNASLPEELKGRVLTTKKVVEGKKFLGSNYWRSEVIHVVDKHPEEVLYDLVDKYRAELLSVKDNPDIQAYAEIVEECHDENDIRGFYFDICCLKQLSDLNLNLDIDIVRTPS